MLLSTQFHAKALPKLCHLESAYTSMREELEVREGESEWNKKSSEEQWESPIDTGTAAGHRQ